MIAVVDAATPPERVAAALRAQGRQVRLVPAATGKPATLDAFATALSFPDYFGHNLDALAECLGDLSWLPRPLAVVWAGAGALQRTDPRLAAAIIRIIEDVVSDEQVAVFLCRQ